MQDSLKFRILPLLLSCFIILTCGFSNPTSVDTKHEAMSAKYRHSEFLKKAGYIVRVFHDGYWWLQYYDDSDRLINEIIDPDQS